MPHSTDQQARDFTTTAMAHSGGRIPVLPAGIAIGVAGLAMIRVGVSESFMKSLRLGQAEKKTREGVERLGTIGNNIARGLVFAGVGVFRIDAAATCDAAEATGTDATSRSFAHTCVGASPLIIVGVGSALFGCARRPRHAGTASSAAHAPRTLDRYVCTSGVPGSSVGGRDAGAPPDFAIRVSAHQAPRCAP